jgi:hypothetical protein
MVMGRYSCRYVVIYPHGPVSVKVHKRKVPAPAVDPL